MENPRSGLNPFYRRNLPHWQPDDRILFITFRLFGSLPSKVLDQLRQQQQLLRKSPPLPTETPRERALRLGKRLFALTDDALVEETNRPNSKSPQWLRLPTVAAMVRDSIWHLHETRYRLHRYCIMPNHVHILICPLEIPERPRDGQAQDLASAERSLLNSGGSAAPGKAPRYWSLGQIMSSLKGWTSHEANRLLGRKGTFWQKESFDHWIRDRPEYYRVIEYIDMNPVKGGLCNSPHDWAWSTAGEQSSESPIQDRPR